MIGGQPSSAESAARQPPLARPSITLWLARGSSLALVLGALALAPMAAAGPAGAASQTNNLQAEAAQLSRQLIQEQLQVDTLNHQYELDSIQVNQDNAAVAAVREQVAHDQRRVRADHVRLSQEAVSAYVNVGSTTLSQTLQLFSDNRESTVNRTEYEGVAIGNTAVTLANLHYDEVQLATTQAALLARTHQDESIQSSAAAATAQARAIAAELAAKQAQVTGQLAVAIAADRNNQAATAVVARAPVGGAVTDPPLPPFLQCVVQRESGGNYQAVSPDGLYMGAFQFSQGTWNEAAQLAGLPQLIGVPPNDASKADQDTLAVALYQADGEQPWQDGCGS